MSYNTFKGFRCGFAESGEYEMKDMQEKEYYKKKIIKLIDSIESVELLAYIYYFISGKMKAE